MGNKELKVLNYNPQDPDLIQFRQLYMRYPKQSNVKRSQLVQNTQELLEYEIVIHNEAFSEVFERNHYINLKKTQMRVDIDLTRFCSGYNGQQMRLLGYNTILNEKKSVGKFMRLKDFVELVTENQKIRILDLSDHSFQFTRKLNPEDKLQIEYRYILKHEILQNNVRILCLQLNPECPYKISITTPELQSVISPTHKLQINNNHIQCNFYKGTDSSLFILLFTMKTELMCTKIQFGAPGYSINQKYCMYLNLPLPTIMYEEMIYFNCEDPQKNQEQETMESMPSYSSITPESINQHYWPYFFNITPITNQRNITFFLDQSNSMEGTKIMLAKQGLQLFIRSLPSECYFNIYSFGSKWRKTFQTYQKICEPILKQCEKEIKMMEGNMGSTFLLGAMNDALLNSVKSSDATWFILTDGRIAEIEEIFTLLKSNPHIRVFSLGFGLEFDQEIVEQLATQTNGSSIFCQNIQSLNSQMIQLLQLALLPKFKMNVKFDTHLHITTMYPSPNRPQRELLCYLDNQQLQDQSEIELDITFGNENEPQVTQQYRCNLRDIQTNYLLHLYGYIQILEKILDEIWYSDSISSILSNQLKSSFDINNPLLLLFFNPLNILMIDNCAVICNINIENLQKLINEQKKSRDYLGLLLQYISDQTYEQAIKCINANEKISEESISIEMGSSYTQANQDYLIKVIQTQQIDGSFMDQQALALVCPSQSMNAILAKMPESNQSQSLVNGRQTQQLPDFILTQIWVTALVIAYLKKYQRQQRGQWIIIYIKAINFIKQYLKNWQSLLYKARIELINAGLK
ncbi:unnamed protein product [Paramecium pentaurelia]|uniref:VWFA domain-containing protein n=1 Tax=Paramecium pentaurelia TaxID=43138 RepID=A0A8S1Y3A9_9CILI|nr:unnamed protein product [Paramecium pentaurelia]